MGRFEFLRPRGSGVVLEVHVQPRASRNEVAGLYRGCLKIRLTSPPVEGEANRECVKFVSKIFKVPQADLEIIQGERSRHKSILIHGAELDELEKSLEAIFST